MILRVGFGYLQEFSEGPEREARTIMRKQMWYDIKSPIRAMPARITGKDQSLAFLKVRSSFRAKIELVNINCQELVINGNLKTLDDD